MGQGVQILRSTGNTPPASLAPGEQAYCEGSGAMYIGTIGGGIVRTNQAGTGSAGIPIGPTQTASYTFVLADANTCVPFDVSSPAGATLPLNSNVPFPIGTRLFVQQVGTGIASIFQNAGVAKTIAQRRTTIAQGEWLCAIKTDTDAWVIFPYIQSSIPESTAISDALNAISVYVDSPNAHYTALLDNNVTGFAVGINSTLVYPTSYGLTFTMRFTQDSTGGWAVTMPSNFHPIAGSDTQVQQDPDAMTLMVATTVDSGTRWEYVMRACG